MIATVCTDDSARSAGHGIGSVCPASPLQRPTRACAQLVATPALAVATAVLERSNIAEDPSSADVIKTGAASAIAVRGL